jgi:hypothetical protein
LLPSFPVLSWLARLEFLFILCVLCWQFCRVFFGFFICKYRCGYCWADR